MTVLTKEMLVQMITLQDQVNSKIDSEWKQTKNPFLRAVYMEIAEAIDHHGWKWWKKQVPNLAAVQMELVDAWHFYLSEMIIRHSDKLSSSLEDTGSEAGHLAEVILLDINQPWSLANESYSLLNLLETLMGTALIGTINIPLFSGTMEAADFSWTDMYKWYIGKNMLNTFRQDNGYKEGTYIKVWNDEREDNDHLTDLLNSYTNMDPETFYNDLRIEFQVMYDTLTKR